MSNPTGKGGFQKGHSGNRAGRPPKARALTTLLATAGRRTIAVEGKRVARQRELARLLWVAVLTNQVILPDGTAFRLEPDEWLGLVKWLYAQIDGPPRPEKEEEPPAPARRADLSALTDDELTLLQQLLTKATPDRGGS